MCQVRDSQLFQLLPLIKCVANFSQRWRGSLALGKYPVLGSGASILPEDPRLPEHLGSGRNHGSRSELEISWREKIRLTQPLLQGALVFTHKGTKAHQDWKGQHRLSNSLVEFVFGNHKLIHKRNWKIWFGHAKINANYSHLTWIAYLIATAHDDGVINKGVGLCPNVWLHHDTEMNTPWPSEMSLAACFLTQKPARTENNFGWCESMSHKWFINSGHNSKLKQQRLWWLRALPRFQGREIDPAFYYMTRS